MSNMNESSSQPNSPSSATDADPADATDNADTGTNNSAFTEQGTAATAKLPKTMLWKDIRKSFSGSMGRFIAIVCLVALGSFALVGLSVTGPDMRDTGNRYFSQRHLADLTVIGSYGLSAGDRKAIDSAPGTSRVEYGYLKDVVLKKHGKPSDESMRIYSATKRVSTYQVTAGRMPHGTGEIAVNGSLAKRHPLGSSLSVNESADMLGHKILRRHSFRVVGQVQSPELTSRVNLGNSTSGSGSLDAFGVTAPAAFDSDDYMVARLTFSNLDAMNDHYSKSYADALQKHRDSLNKALKARPAARLQEIKDSQKPAMFSAERQIADGKAKLATAQQQLPLLQAQLTDPNARLQAQNQFDEQSRKLRDSESKLNQAQATLDSLETPTYSVDSRREAPGSDGYTVYDSVSDIVDSLSRIFPYFLYLVAALVTFSTMTRFVQEERINSGTLKALGYGNGDVMKKFLVYGSAASALGALIGIVAGHTLLPAIVYAAYGHAFDMPFIEMNFHWPVTLLAVVLAFVSAVVPAFLSARKELREKPAALLLPKAPANGSKILLEHIPFIWNRLNFTHKVTARNIFRYKQRMFMTIFGVCGSVALLMAGFAVQGSISGINAHQFGPILDYSLIAVENNHVSDAQTKAIDTRLKQNDVKRSAKIHYEDLNKTAGSNNDKQDITLIVPQSTKSFNDYVKLHTRKGGTSLALNGNGGKGAVISERFAKLTHAKVGGSIDVNDANGHSHKVKISGICEMYMGHFMFMSPGTYRHTFHTKFAPNGYIVTLNDGGVANVKHRSASFMRLAGIQGVQQNTALMTQIDTVVSSLNIIMWVLIIVATLLGVVILYNLTNLNVTERIRELSTIKVLGFYDPEVTMYIYRETILLSGLGVLVGYLFGAWLHRYIITAVPPDNVMFDPTIDWAGFVVPLVLVVVITAVLGWYVNRKLSRIDMLDALKSVD